MKILHIFAGLIGLLAVPTVAAVLKPFVPTNEELGDKLSDKVVEVVRSDTARTAKVKGHMFPFTSELLKNPIVLKDNCSNITIKEWWGTEITPQSVNIINQTCNKAYRHFFPFVRMRGYKPDPNVKFEINVSMLPWSPLTNGRDYRALNDMTWRFEDRTRFCDEDGRICEAWETPFPLLGCASRIEKWIFIMNDVTLNDPEIPPFASVFSHELFHMYSFYYEVFDQYPGNENQKIAMDEKMARQFTASLGYTR